MFHNPTDPCLATLLGEPHADVGCICDRWITPWADHGVVSTDHRGELVFQSRPYTRRWQVEPSVWAFAREHGLAAEVFESAAGTVLIELRLPEGGI